jgi:hypothetical protein
VPYPIFDIADIVKPSLCLVSPHYTYKDLAVMMTPGHRLLDVISISGNKNHPSILAGLIHVLGEMNLPQRGRIPEIGVFTKIFSLQYSTNKKKP